MGDGGEAGSRETAAESEGRGSGKVEVEGRSTGAQRHQGQTPTKSEDRGSGEGECRGYGGGDEGRRESGELGEEAEEGSPRGGYVKIALAVAWEKKTCCC